MTGDKDEAKEIKPAHKAIWDKIKSELIDNTIKYIIGAAIVSLGVIILASYNRIIILIDEHIKTVALSSLSEKADQADIGTLVFRDSKRETSLYIMSHPDSKTFILIRPEGKNQGEISVMTEDGQTQKTKGMLDDEFVIDMDRLLSKPKATPINYLQNIAASNKYLKNLHKITFIYNPPESTSSKSPDRNDENNPPILSYVVFTYPPAGSVFLKKP